VNPCTTDHEMFLPFQEACQRTCCEYQPDIGFGDDDAEGDDNGGDIGFGGGEDPEPVTSDETMVITLTGTLETMTEADKDFVISEIVDCFVFRSQQRLSAEGMEVTLESGSINAVVTFKSAEKNSSAINLMHTSVTAIPIVLTLSDGSTLEQTTVSALETVDPPGTVAASANDGSMGTSASVGTAVGVILLVAFVAFLVVVVWSRKANQLQKKLSIKSLSRGGFECEPRGVENEAYTSVEVENQLYATVDEVVEIDQVQMELAAVDIVENETDVELETDASVDENAIYVGEVEEESDNNGTLYAIIEMKENVGEDEELYEEVVHVGQIDEEGARYEELYEEAATAVQLVDEEVVQVDEEAVQVDEEVVQADEEVVQADEEVVQADEEVVQADKEVVQVDEQVVQANEEVVQVDEEDV